MADTIISVGGDTSQLEREIQKSLSKDFKLSGLDAKSFSQPLGKIKGQLGEFEKSLEASNARVVAFGASAGSIYLLTDAFKSMVKSTIDVEKTLADINTVINASEKDIKSFGNAIFDVANKTSQSFETAAEAALEFSRQGLGLEQTAKRTSDALTLARLSGLSAASSVEALTAAVNSFSDAGLTTTQIVNKLAAVDAKYAVSSADLAEAIKRVGSSASEAGVSIDQLVALVTSAQQTTARGGAVIGNSFKTIFTRLQRPKVLDDLKEVGIQTTNAYGETLPLIQIITQLARTFDTLGSAQRSQVAELVGGVYQINILKAVLGDLSKEYSTYSGALKASSGATNEAEARIGKLGETLDSQINRVTNNLKRAGSIVGELTIAPALEKVLSNVNGVLETFALGKEPEGYGEKAAVGFLKGLGSFISGPGLLLGATAAYQIFRRLATFVGDAGKTVLGLGQAAQQQSQIQAQILQVLQKNPQVYAQIESGAISVQSAAQGYLNIVNATNAALERQKAIAAQMAGTIAGGGLSPITSTPRGRGRAAGYMPSISDQKKMEENDARALGAPSGVRAHFGKGTIGGKKFLMNSHEIEIPNAGANGDSAVIPKYASGSVMVGAINYPKVRKALADAPYLRSGLEFSDRITLSSFNHLTGDDNPAFKKQNNESAKDYESRIIKKLGYNDNSRLQYLGNSAIDGYKGNSLLEVKSGNYSLKDVKEKFFRAPAENAHLKINQSWNKFRKGVLDNKQVFGTLISPNAAGYIPRFAAGDGSISLKDYMMMKYGEIKDTSSLGGAALNAAYGKGVSLDELRATAPKWANWTPGGATTAMRQGRAEAKKQTQINRANKYGYRKIILPWSKSVADFGGDPNEFGDAYENLVAQKFGAKRGDRFKRANDYPGIAGRTPESKYNYTDVDFIVPKVAGDLSQGGSLIEARGGDKKNYNASDISKKFDNFFKNNPSYDSNKWNRILVSRNAAGYIPRFAKGSKQKRRARYYRNNPRPLSLVPSGKEYTGEQTNTPSKPALKLAPRFTQQDLLQQRIDEAQAKSQAQKKAKFAYPTRILPPSISPSVVPAQPTQPARLTAEERLARAKASGKTLLSGGPGKAAKFDSGKAFMASMAISQGLGMAQSFGLINPESAAGQATTKGLEFLNLGLTAKGLYSEYAPSIGKKIASSGIGKRIAGSAIGRGVAGSMGRSAILGSMGGGFGAIAAPLAAAYGVGKIGQEAIDYFGTPGGFGTRDINKEQENAVKELAKYKTETGKSISGYVSAASSKYGLGNEDLGALRKGAIGNIANDLGGIQNVGRLLKESGGAGGGKGSADAFTKNVISSLQALGKEVGDLADPKNFGKAKDLAAGLISEVKKFETLKSTTKTFNEVSTAMTTLTSKANMVLTVLRDLAQKETARGEALKKNFAGGVEGYLDPSKTAEANIGIDRALRNLNDPRLARNQMERGRAANEFLTKTKELGIDLPPQVREQMSQIMAQGMKQFQGQNLGFLGRLGGSYRNDFGLRTGMIRSDAAMEKIAKEASLTKEMYMLSGNQQAVEAGVLNPLQGKTMSLYGNPEAIKPFLETERKIQQRKDDFDRLTQGRIKGTVPENVYNEVAQKMIDASKLQQNSTSLVGQKDALRKMEDAFFGLDERLMAIAKLGEQFTQNAANVNINGGVTVDLTKDAKEFLTIEKRVVDFFTGKKDKEKSAPPQYLGGMTAPQGH
jgi:TP901 family phage tail tape measure protein